MQHNRPAYALCPPQYCSPLLQIILFHVWHLRLHRAYQKPCILTAAYVTLQRRVFHDCCVRACPQIVNDLRTLRELATALLRYDCVTFLTLLDTLRLSEGRNSVWLFHTAAHTIFQEVCPLFRYATFRELDIVVPKPCSLSRPPQIKPCRCCFACCRNSSLLADSGKPYTTCQTSVLVSPLI